MFQNDSWFTWDPDPRRAFEEHDATLEPYASMSKEEIIEAIQQAKGGREWEFLREFLIDKCSAEEFHYERFLRMLREATEAGPEESCYLELAEPATRLIVTPPAQAKDNAPSEGARHVSAVGGD